MATVALYAHDVEPDLPTGIGFYVRRLIGAIRAVDTAAHGLTYRVGASPARRIRRASKPDFPVLRSRLPRKALHLSWGLLHRPRIDPVLGHPDLIHVLSPAFPVPSRARIVYTLHDLWPLTSPHWYPAKERWFNRLAINDAASRATLIIADSQWIAGQLTATLGVDPGRIRVVHLAVDDRFFCSPDAADVRRVCAAHGVEPGRYLVAVGAISRRKNLPTVIEALAGLKLRPPSLKLLAIGPPDLGFEETHALVGQRHLEDVVRFTGWLPTEEARLLLSGAAALVHPSADEGFGMTPLEAMACGVPALVSNAGSLPEVASDAGILLDPYDPDLWATAICQLDNDEGFREELVSRGRAHAARFTWDRVATETIAAHRAALSL